MTRTKRRFLLALPLAILCLIAALAWSQPKPPRIGIFLRSAQKEPQITDPLAALKVVQSLGIHTIQVSKLPDRFYTPAGTAEFIGDLQQTGITAASVVAVYDGESYKDIPTIRDTVGFRPAALLPARIAYTKQCVDLAVALHSPIVTFHVGMLPDDTADPIYQQMLKATQEVVTYAGTKHVTISLETGQESAEHLLRFLNLLKGPRVGINFDMANLVLYGKDESLAALKKLYPRVTSVHVKDGVLPTSPTALGKETALGEGRGETRACLEFLKSKGFTGPLIIETYLSRNTGSDPAQDLARSRDFIQKVYAGN